MKSKIIIGPILLTVMLIAVFLFFNYGQYAKQLVVYAEAGEIDLAKFIPGDWEKLCIVPPYATSLDTPRIFGTYINITSRSSITGNDGIVLLGVMKNDSVVGLYELSFKYANLSAYANQCFQRDNVRFKIALDGHPDAEHISP